MPKGFKGCPCGGLAGALRNLSPAPAPPIRGYRIIPGWIWCKKVYPAWRTARARAIIGQPFHPVLLAPQRAIGVYFTDRDSLEGVGDPTQCARRAALRRADHYECQRYGCVLVAFDIPDIALVQIPPRHQVSVPA